MPRSFTADPARTRVLSEQWGTWVLPHWLERQADPTSPAFVPAPPTGGVVNRSQVDCVPVGVLDGGALATVDPRGLVTFSDGAWSLDWWVGADDRWHLPAREVAVRQRLVDDVPVVETAMRVPGGDLVQRVWAFRDTTAGDVVAVEIHNESRLPVAIALGLRPYGPGGAGRIDQIEVTAEQVMIDGDLAAWLPKAASHAVGSTFEQGDAARLVLDGAAGRATDCSIACGAGFATAALVYPLPHTASIRFLIPAANSTAATRPEAIPPHEAVARGWTTQLAAAARFELPDAELAAMLRAASAQLLIAASGRELAGDTSTTETASVVDALDRLGFADAAGAIVATVPLGQGVGGRLGGTDPAADATGAALMAAGRHWRTSRDGVLAAELAGPLAAGAHHHTRSRLRPFARRVVVGESIADLGWRLRGIIDVAEALDATGQPDAAEALRALASEVRTELDARLAIEPTEGGAAVHALALVSPLDLLDARHDVIDGILEWVEGHAHEGGVAQLVGPTGLSPELTALVGRVELRRGDLAAMTRIEWLVRAAGPARTWSDMVHPRLGTGCGAAGWSAGAAAAFVHLTLDLLVHETGDGRGLVLCPVWPESWLGAGVEVHDVPTTLGRVSYAVRWHGERPALLWEIAPHPGVDSVSLTIPGLDPSWSSNDLRGDALLARPAVAPATHSPPGPVEGESFG